MTANAQKRFDELVAGFASRPGVTAPETGGGFGSAALRVHNKIFAMMSHGRLVVKLPRARVDALVAAGEGSRFDANKGTGMKEWLSLEPASRLAWQPLCEEALEFVSGRR
jgi:hypothetical protein